MGNSVGGTAQEAVDEVAAAVGAQDDEVGVLAVGQSEEPGGGGLVLNEEGSDLDVLIVACAGLGVVVMAWSPSWGGGGARTS